MDAIKKIEVILVAATLSFMIGSVIVKDWLPLIMAQSEEGYRVIGYIISLLIFPLWITAFGALLRDER